MPQGFKICWLALILTVAGSAEHQLLPQGRAEVTGQTFRETWNLGFSTQEESQRAYQELLTALKTEQEPYKRLESISTLLDKIPKNDSFTKLRLSLSENAMNAPLIALLLAREKSLEGLKTGSGKGFLQGLANRVELSRRLQSKFQLGKNEADKVARVLQLPGEAVPTLLSRSFERSKLQSILSSLSENHGLNDEEKQFQEALTYQFHDAKVIPPKKRSEGRPPPFGTLLPESTKGHFLMTQAVMGGEALEVAKTILKEGGYISVLGDDRKRFTDFVATLPENQRGHLTLLDIKAKPGAWPTDYHALAVRENGTQKTFLLDPKYYRDRTSDLVPARIERQVSGWPNYQFPYFLEGGNTIGLPGKNGKPVVIVSDSFENTNALSGSLPEDSVAALKNHLAFEGDLTIIPGLNDRTGHVDMFLKPSLNDKLYIAEFNTFSSPEEKGYDAVKRAQDSLNEVENLLDPKVSLIKVPQIPPYKGKTFSKLNSLSFKINGKKVFIIPDYPSHPLNSAVNDAMKRIITENEGEVTIHFLKAESIREFNGVLHCMFPQVEYIFTPQIMGK